MPCLLRVFTMKKCEDNDNEVCRLCSLDKDVLDLIDLVSQIIIEWIGIKVSKGNDRKEICPKCAKKWKTTLRQFKKKFQKLENPSKKKQQKVKKSKKNVIAKAKNISSPKPDESGSKPSNAEKDYIQKQNLRESKTKSAGSKGPKLVTSGKDVKKEEFSCNFCKKIYKRRFAFDNHQKKCHFSVVNADLPQKKTVKKPSCTCKQCGRQLRSRANLTSHGQYCGTDRAFPCKTCGHQFETEKHLKRHDYEKHRRVVGTKSKTSSTEIKNKSHSKSATRSMDNKQSYDLQSTLVANKQYSSDSREILLPLKVRCKSVSLLKTDKKSDDNGLDLETQPINSSAKIITKIYSKSSNFRIDNNQCRSSISSKSSNNQDDNNNRHLNSSTFRIEKNQSDNVKSPKSRNDHYENNINSSNSKALRMGIGNTIDIQKQTEKNEFSYNLCENNKSSKSSKKECDSNSKSSNSTDFRIDSDQCDVKSSSPNNQCGNKTKSLKLSTLSTDSKPRNNIDEDDEGICSPKNMEEHLSLNKDRGQGGVGTSSVFNGGASHLRISPTKRARCEHSPKQITRITAQMIDTYELKKKWGKEEAASMIGFIQSFQQ